MCELRDMVPRRHREKTSVSFQRVPWVVRNFSWEKSDFLLCVLLIRNNLSINNRLLNYLSHKDINRQYSDFFSFLRKPLCISKVGGEIKHSMN